MGAWGYGSFENDTALDWVGDFGDGPSLKLLIDAIQPRADELGGIPEDEVWDEEACPTALAAGEVVAAMRGHAHPEFPEELVEWVEQNRASADARLVKQAIRAATMARQSELFRSCFMDEEGIAAWEAEVDDLLRRLKA